jgi:hypothetical protein
LHRLHAARDRDLGEGQADCVLARLESPDVKRAAIVGDRGAAGRESAHAAGDGDAQRRHARFRDRIAELIGERAADGRKAPHPHGHVVDAGVGQFERCAEPPGRRMPVAATAGRPCRWW